MIVSCEYAGMTRNASTRLLIAAFSILLFQPSLAAPDRASLLSAWAEAMTTLPSTLAFEERDDGGYHLADDSLPYEGEVRVVSSIVRPVPMAESTGFTHTGLVEFELVDLPAELRESQSYYYWLADRQMLYYSDADDGWLASAQYQAALQTSYEEPYAFGPLSFMLNYGIWVVLLALLLWVFLTLSRQQRKARTLMDETASINEMARENIERSAEIQQESIEITRKVLEIQEANRRVLEQIRDNTAR